MPNSFQDSVDRLTGRMVDLLWHQWSSIGVAGNSRSGDDAMIIDPEALLLATTRFGRHDSRLMDESIDWLMQFGHRICLQRLQGLDKNWSNVADRRVLAAIAGVLGQQAIHRKWRAVGAPAIGNAKPEPVFIGEAGNPDANVREPEPAFLKLGLMRGKLELRGMSKPPDPRNRRNLLFTLRALLGVNARAEIMGWLLTHESGHPAAIARSTGYFSKSIQQILNEMAESGQVASFRVGREKHFYILRREAWQALLFPPLASKDIQPQWIEWMPLFAATTCFAEALGKPDLDGKSEHFQAIQLREALDQATPALAQAGVIHRIRAAREMRGAHLVQSLLADLESLIP